MDEENRRGEKCMDGWVGEHSAFLFIYMKNMFKKHKNGNVKHVGALLLNLLGASKWLGIQLVTEWFLYLLTRLRPDGRE